MGKMKEKVVVGMSGGVDSSFALIKLKELGFEPVGVSLKLPVWDSKENVLRENRCCTKESLDIARSVCKKKGVPYHTYDVQKAFKQEVINYILKELSAGRTPNPCVICNRKLKFRKLLEWAKKRGIKYVATGHYAKVKFNKKTKEYELFVAKDKEKDQTYGLAYLTQEQLSHIILPLGDFKKEEVISFILKKGFDAYKKKKESQDFCFVGRKAYQKFLRKEVGIKKGDIVDKHGKVLGQHDGLHFFTIGQKRGLKLPSKYCVKDKNRKKNTLIVSDNKRNLNKKEVILEKVNFISNNKPKLPLKVKARSGYGQRLKKGTLKRAKENYKIVFDRFQDLAAPGQFCVFYKGEKCLGCGIISRGKK